jgi:hypothetical protein
MSFDPDRAFDLMLCMYRSGLLDRFSAIQGRAIDEVMEETGISMGDIMNRMDQAGDRTVDSIDRLIGRAGPFVKYMTNETVMRSAARVLDVGFVRRFLQSTMKKSILKVFAAGVGDAMPAAQVAGRS